MSKTKQHYKLVSEAETLDEAMNCGLICLKYFLKNHFMKTMIFLIIVFGFIGYVANDYITSQKMTIKEALPISENKNSLEFELMPKAYAESVSFIKDEDKKIIVNGKVFGIIDTNYIIYVSKSSAKDIFIYNKISNKAVFIPFPTKLK